MTIHEHPFAIETPRGHTVHGDVRHVEGAAPGPTVVMCHGFKGFKDWGTFPAWGAHLAAHGFTSVLFNFSHNGVGPEAPMDFTQLDRFADNTFTTELDDLAAVLDAAASGGLPGPIDPDRLGLMGHSRGGGTALLQAAVDPRIKALATWSAVAGFVERFTPQQRADWVAQGYTEIRNARTGQVMRLNRVLYDDAQAHRDRLDLLAHAGRVSVPWLLVHAHDDVPVPLAEAHQLLAVAPHATFFEAEGGHTFGGRHPAAEVLPESLFAVFERTTAFFRSHL